jgi:hypothetical protein
MGPQEQVGGWCGRCMMYVGVGVWLMHGSVHSTQWLAQSHHVYDVLAALDAQESDRHPQ